tara:strand:- start:388 stop:693 length:306 start_codon:yes stop_codon:yes gene_type:complete
MSYDDFLRFKGDDIVKASREEACQYLYTYGRYTCWTDWFWKEPDRDAYWKAMYWTERGADDSRTLHERCSAIRQAKKEWKRFQNFVSPVASLEPTVPPLPD